jgi:hypothetical protein
MHCPWQPAAHQNVSQPMKDHDFYLKVARALTGCQLVEQELKLYIAEALQLAKKRIGDQMPFRMSAKDYENAPLERLVTTFSKLTNNEPLVSSLNKFKDERNFLSHKAITHCLDPEGELSILDVSDVQLRLDSIQRRSEELVREINEEANKWRGNLWFENLDNKDG